MKQKIIDSVMIALTAMMTVITILSVLFVLPFSLLSFGLYFMMPSPPKPEVEYGEFPFELVYEINGEVVEVEDTIVCEYQGVESTANGKYLRWTQYMKSTGEENLLVYENEEVALYYNLGSAYEYMGDCEPHELINENFVPNTYPVHIGEFDGRLADEILETYDVEVELISFKPTNSIENTFK